ncbi:MAG: thiamine pyrophosphate-dependent enzyme, partial [Bacteroidales bacterium]
MPKSQFINPNEARKPGKITFGEIPINQYQKSIDEEKKNFSNDDLQRIYRDMTVIREFETLLNSVKTTGEYHGVKYNYPGPAHLSIGQEAAAVGMAYNLTIEDFILGSHRSHGEILAKGLSAIEQLSDDDLMRIMKEFFDGAILQVVEKNHKGDVKDLAIKFLLYGTLAEIFGRKTGINRGLGGSMHAFFTPFGIYPNNAVVGGSGDIAVGAALYKKVNQKNGIVVANIGDASMGCGPVWEGMTFASMNQFKELWTGDYQGGMPIIFNFMNNQYGMGGQPEGETMGFDSLARVGAGVNPEMMHAERIDGYNPLAVIDAFSRKKQILEEKKGPVLLDTLTYRISGHSPSDASTYRTKEEIEAWQEKDSLQSFKDDLLNNQVATEKELNSTQTSTIELLKEIYNLAIDEEISPRLELDKDPNLVGKMMFSNQSIEKMEDRKPETLIPKEENPRLKQLAKRHRYGLDENGNPHSTVKTYQLRDGIFEAILDKFYTDPTLVAYGEENRDWGGAFAVYRGLTEALPYNRLFNSPISEGAIVGTAIGYGMAGGRVIAEIMY